MNNDSHCSIKWSEAWLPSTHLRSWHQCAHQLVKPTLRTIYSHMQRPMYSSSHFSHEQFLSGINYHRTLSRQKQRAHSTLGYAHCNIKPPPPGRDTQREVCPVSTRTRTRTDAQYLNWSTIYPIFSVLTKKWMLGGLCHFHVYHTWGWGHPGNYPNFIEKSIFWLPW